MQRWLKRVTPDRQALEKLWCLKHFTALVPDRGCWTFNRSSVTRAFALGLFIAFIPPTPLPRAPRRLRDARRVFPAESAGAGRDGFHQQPASPGCRRSRARIWVGAKLMGLDLMPFLHPISHGNLDGNQRALAAAAARGAGAGPDRGRRRLRAGARRLACPRHLPAAAAPCALKRPQRRARPAPHPLRSGPDRAARPVFHRGSRSRDWCRVRG